jgi:hypothetical protein
MFRLRSLHPKNQQRVLGDPASPALEKARGNPPPLNMASFRVGYTNVGTALSGTPGLKSSVILSRAFRRRTCRDMSNLIAASVALPPKTCVWVEEPRKCIYVLSIAVGPSREDALRMTILLSVQQDDRL